MKYSDSHVSILTSMTRKTKLAVSWKKKDIESVTEAICPEAAQPHSHKKTPITKIIPALEDHAISSRDVHLCRGNAT